MDINEQYQHPLWQKKKNEIYVRDGWTCQSCKKDCYQLAAQLHAHHIYRVKNYHLWDYDNESIITLCRDCHEKADDPALKKIAGILVWKMFIGEIDPIELSIPKDNGQKLTGRCECNFNRESFNIDGHMYCGSCKKEITGL